MVRFSVAGHNFNANVPKIIHGAVFLLTAVFVVRYDNDFSEHIFKDLLPTLVITSPLHKFSQGGLFYEVARIAVMSLPKESVILGIDVTDVGDDCELSTANERQFISSPNFSLPFLKSGLDDLVQVVVRDVREEISDGVSCLGIDSHLVLPLLRGCLFIQSLGAPMKRGEIVFCKQCPS